MLLRKPALKVGKWQTMTKEKESGVDELMSRSMWRTLFLFLVLALVLTGCGKPYLSALDPAGPVAEKQLSLIKLSLYIMIVVIAVVMIIYVYVLVKFRQRPGQKGYPEQVEGSHTLEIIWTVIPIILLIILAIPTVVTTFTLAETYPEEEEGDALLIKVTAHQYWWEVEYPEQGIVTAQDIYIPTGQRVYFELTSKDVIHSFWVPSLGGKTDTNPGLTNNMWLQADEPGVYHGKCAELCGPSHALMDFKVIAVEPEEFEQWVATMTNYDDTPKTVLAEQGRAVFEQSCIACHATDGVTKSPYPNLAGIGDREKIAGILQNNEENLARWIENPEEVKEGNYMPSASELGLNENDIEALVEYLMQLKLQ
ncbi:cytochrome c oxidase, subunit II [Caldalkalibacillus thermarum TA2.A1]|uniref:Cytochrome c oxidase subunit 2 n=2 Tax=Caldalkalibacillus thermarum (strain TA2.A1) TaxID=986075 RepID=F5L9Q5_CALTT|nr:cytochrome c oxidase, subunit II [Caldalkalibacillus thermarum TA2.A1]